MREGLINEMRASAQTGTPLENEKFQSEIEELLGIKVGHNQREDQKVGNR